MAINTQTHLDLDCKNLVCPIPIIKIAQAIKLVPPGGTVRMEATDPGSRYDVPAWARRTGNELVESQLEGPVFSYLVRRVR